jgi:hypothetical protein
MNGNQIIAAAELWQYSVSDFPKMWPNPLNAVALQPEFAKPTLNTL